VVTVFSKIGTVHVKFGGVQTKISTVHSKFGEKNHNQSDLIFFNTSKFLTPPHMHHHPPGPPVRE
jgi:hypothetical protein